MKKYGFVLGLLAVVLFIVVLPASADDLVEGRAGRAEVRFLEGMIDHHQMALDMAADCLEKTVTAEVKTLCQNVIAAQSGEIATMQSWLNDWYSVTYEPVSMQNQQDNSSGGMSGHMAMGDAPGMMGMMAGLNELEGVDYEIAWLEAMIDHHDDALNMSRRILRRGEHAELLDLAQQIIDDQTAEIEAMEQMITRLSAQ